MARPADNYYPISVSFELDLGVPLLPRTACIGRFLQPTADSVATLAASRAPPPAPCLASGSTGLKVVLHNNNTHTAAAKRSAKRGHKAGDTVTAVGGHNEETAVQLLSFGKEVTALAAGALYRDAAAAHLQQQDVLLFGAATSLLAYDVNQNKQLFYKDVEDGVRSVVCGPVTTTDTAEGEAPVLAVVGSNCSIFGFDQCGTERYWAVTGDQVTAMAFVRWRDGDSTTTPVLVAASEDFEIRVCDGEKILGSITEVNTVVQLVASSHVTGRFAYLLSNGTVGVYQHFERLWRIKTKCKPVAAAFCDVDCDGVEELVVGFDNGRVEVRSDKRPDGGNVGGELLFRDTYDAPVASVLAADYRQDGRMMPLVCTVNGIVRGLTLLEAKIDDAQDTQEALVLEALSQKKQALVAQLASLEEQVALKKNGDEDATLPEAGVSVEYCVHPNFLTEKLDIALTVKNAPSDIVIQSCTLTADDAVIGESAADTLCFYPDNLVSRLVCSVTYPRDVSTVVRAAVVVGSVRATNYHIHDLCIPVPTFAAYQLPVVLQEEYQLHSYTYRVPEGYVKILYDSPLRMDALEAWLRISFGIPANWAFKDASNLQAPVLQVELLSMRGAAPLAVEVLNAPTGFKSVVIRADSMEVCGAVVGSLSAVEGGIASGGVAPSSVWCEFPSAMNHFSSVLQRVDEADAVRQKLSTDMADSAAIVKTLLIRAEDARLLGDMENMRKTYATLHEVNRELMGENMKRVNNYEDLKAALKEVNAFIQKAGALRMGPAKASLIAACRNALKEKKSSALVNLIRTGMG